MVSHKGPLSRKGPLSYQALFRVPPVVSLRTQGVVAGSHNLGTSKSWAAPRQSQSMGCLHLLPQGDGFDPQIHPPYLGTSSQHSWCPQYGYTNFRSPGSPPGNLPWGLAVATFLGCKGGEVRRHYLEDINSGSCIAI
ncbi:hypothetical protein L873DRAFT_29211 [Choiromyces venosus 120613-1]|uniref:Uncharacterized protein n=1 Tax=Choiromyces venosus 120613-1 TaxID=1336337 RepID=A0A3N4KCP2_9PEZI|nr:hypothetical protein L873DRAFT_29211 [Choiromyces venosus 120613-1]